MANIPNLDHVKEHLRVDNDFLDDDVYIQSLIPRAVQWVEKFTDASIGDLPEATVQAVLIKIGDFYDVERNSYSGLKENNAAERLLIHYRNITF
jgi:hypothetical protein